MTTIADRIKAAMELRGIKQADLVSMTGIGKSSISTYLSGEYEPKQKNIYKIAKVLNVNEAWLMGEAVPMERFDWEAFQEAAAEHERYLNDALDAMSSGVTFAGTAEKAIIYKASLPPPDIEKEESALLENILLYNHYGPASKVRSLRILSELVFHFSEEEQRQLVSYAEFIEAERQKRLGINIRHRYQGD